MLNVRILMSEFKQPVNDSACPMKYSSFIFLVSLSSASEDSKDSYVIRIDTYFHILFNFVCKI